MSLFLRFLNDERGTTAIEYALIAGLISVVIIGGARAIGVNIQAKLYGPLGGALS